MVLDEAKIQNVIVIGEGINSDGQRESHAWNYVKLEGMWYAIDVTWDDPIIRGSGSLNKKSKSYGNIVFLMFTKNSQKN